MSGIFDKGSGIRGHLMRKGRKRKRGGEEKERGKTTDGITEKREKQIKNHNSFIINLYYDSYNKIINNYLSINHYLKI